MQYVCHLDVVAGGERGCAFKNRDYRVIGGFVSFLPHSVVLWEE